MKPRAVFAMPEDRNKMRGPRLTSKQGRKASLKRLIRSQKKGLRRAQAVTNELGSHRLAANSG